MTLSVGYIFYNDKLSANIHVPYYNSNYDFIGGIGVGHQHVFTPYFGAFFEAGFEFFAGNGGYYTHFDIDKATLDNDKVIFPAGFGMAFFF